jgi:hypothetical protein
MRYRPSSIAPGAKRPWLIESEDVSQPWADPGRGPPPCGRVAVGGWKVAVGGSGAARVMSGSSG